MPEKRVKVVSDILFALSLNSFSFFYEAPLRQDRLIAFLNFHLILIAFFDEHFVRIFEFVMRAVNHQVVL